MGGVLSAPVYWAVYWAAYYWAEQFTLHASVLEVLSGMTREQEWKDHHTEGAPAMPLQDFKCIMKARVRLRDKFDLQVLRNKAVAVCLLLRTKYNKFPIFYVFYNKYSHLDGTLLTLIDRKTALWSTGRTITTVTGNTDPNLSQLCDFHWKVIENCDFLWKTHETSGRSEECARLCMHWKPWSSEPRVRLQHFEVVQFSLLVVWPKSLQFWNI